MDPIDIAFAGIAQQADLVRTRAISARELVGVSLDRIEELNPRLNAIASLWPEAALAQAKRPTGGPGGVRWLRCWASRSW